MRRGGKQKLANVSTPLSTVTRFVLPVELVRESLGVLHAAGREGAEAFVLWGGTAEGDTCTVRSVVVPDQTPHRTSSGLLVTVTGEALFTVNRELFGRGELLAAQMHSHPTHAFHSDTDDCHALVTMAGSLSVVVPDFADGGLARVRDWAWYRLAGRNKWNELTRRDRIELIHPGEEVD